jgi:hypothetical protein
MHTPAPLIPPTHPPTRPRHQVGDGTTTVVILSGEFLREAKPYVEEGVHARVSVGGMRWGSRRDAAARRGQGEGRLLAVLPERQPLPDLRCRSSGRCLHQLESSGGKVSAASHAE